MLHANFMTLMFYRTIVIAESTNNLKQDGINFGATKEYLMMTMPNFKEPEAEV